MSSKITESPIETFAIELLEKHGYQYIYGPDIALDSETPERTSPFEDVLLLEKLISAVSRINPAIPADAREDTHQKDRNSHGDLACSIDVNKMENNAFIIMNQHPFIDNTQGKQ